MFMYALSSLFHFGNGIGRCFVPLLVSCCRHASFHSLRLLYIYCRGFLLFSWYCWKVNLVSVSVEINMFMNVFVVVVVVDWWLVVSPAD